MRSTVNPLFAAAMSVLLVAAGLYLGTSGSGGSAVLGWVFVGVGGLSALGNLALWWWQRRQGL